MTNIIEFPQADKERYLQEDGDIIGIISLENDLEVECSDKEIKIRCHDMFANFESRKQLAEFLWMAVRFVDSEGRYEKSNYVGKNYV